MKRDLIHKLLNEQTTPEEEHLIARMLQQEEDMEQWLTEDETAEYDRIVSQRKAKYRMLRWAIAAVVVVLISAGAIVLMPREQTGDTIAEHEAKGVTTPAVHHSNLSIAESASSKPAERPVRTTRRMRQQAIVSTTDSLQYYIARLEKELENVNESTYTAKAEEVLRADARLQKLVQRIMMGELTKETQPQEALNTNIMTEEQP